jgi:type I restriction-modification system DNA methylase subunit
MSELSQQITSYLWQATDLLRGVVTSSKSVEYCAGLLLLRLLNDDLPNKTAIVDWEAIRQSTNPCKLIDSAINSLRGHYTETELGFLFDLNFDELCGKPALYRDLVEVISRVELSDLQHGDFSEVADAILSTLSLSMGTQSGEFFTPSNIADLMVTLVDPQPDSSIYDPACGSGTLLLAAHHYATQKGISSLHRVHGHEINPSIAKIARMNIHLHGLSAELIETGDTLADSQSKHGSDKKFDIILMNPPIGTRHDKAFVMHLQHTQSYFNYGPPTTIADYNFIQFALSRLNKNGKATILVSLRPLFASGPEAGIRKNLVEKDLLDAVITLPSNVLAHTAAQPAILIFHKDKPPERKGKILFIHADSEEEAISKALNSSSQLKIIDTYRKLISQRKFSALVSTQEVSSKEYVLLPSIYVGLEELDIFLGSDVQRITLGQIASVMPGTDLGSLPKGNIPVLQGRDLNVSSLSIEDLSKKDVPSSLTKIVRAQAGDILIQRIGQKPQSLLVTEELDGILVANTAYVIKFEKRDDLRSRYLVEFLNSSAGHAKLTSAISGAVIPTLRLSSLRELEVPIPNRSVMELIKDIYTTESALLDRASKAGNLRKQLFSIETPDEFNDRLRSMSIEAQVLSQSLTQSGSINFQIRNYYPFVIAYAYRFLDAIANETELYKEQLRVAENILAFLGSVGLALTVATRALQEGEPKNFTKQMIYEYWQNGISPGHWRDMANRSATILRSNDRFAAIKSFASIWFKGKGSKQSDFGIWTQDLVNRKNDFKHDRGPQTPQEYSQEAKLLATELESCLKEIAFFVQYPTRYILETDTDWKTNQHTVNTLVYVGDHPGLRQERISVMAPLPREKLYLEIKENALISLYPLLSVHYCDSCKTKETYLIDRWNPSEGRTIIKSFERGHTHNNDEIAKRIETDLEHWLKDAFSSSS